jgi:hypothetical protein
MPLEVFPIGKGRVRHIIFRRTGTYRCESFCGISGSIRLNVFGKRCKRCEIGQFALYQS